MAAISSDSFNRSRIAAVIVAIITSNTDLAAAPGNVSLAAGIAGLGKDSVVNISQITTLDKRQLSQYAGRLHPADSTTSKTASASLLPAS